MSTPQKSPEEPEPEKPPSRDDLPTLEDLFEQADMLREAVQNHTQALRGPWPKGKDR
ncbi:hypothetical protein Stsp01_46240 [Streptomyces sp. NBRC 13847]|uniref:hypothetical protein n=1 Tax=Streptomyces TaxID=1883 RepID=UPI0024A319F3|nr:hypothetical protein [Streptomyces sp. NBRC 13847]GLW17881.1 hypothetical protein Stsp01_46240 [Streptomyces sp. NBRC 13847]